MPDTQDPTPIGDARTIDPAGTQARLSPRVLRVGHTGITVSDLNRSLHFYRRVLGFPVTPPMRIEGELVERITGVRGAKMDVAFVNAPGHPIELLCFREPAEPHKSILRPCDTGFFHLCLRVRTIDEVVAAAAASGFEPQSEIQTIDGGPFHGMRVVYLRDPDGVWLELAEDATPVSFEEIMLSRAR